MNRNTSKVRLKLTKIKENFNTESQFHDTEHKFELCMELRDLLKSWLFALR